MGGVRHAHGDQRAQQDVLDAVAEAAEQVSGDRHRQDRPRSLDAHPEALHGERDEGAGGDAARRDTACECGGAGDHPGHPRADDERVTAVAGPDDVLDVEDLDRQCGGEQHERGGRGTEGDAQHAIAAQQAQAVKRAQAVRRRRGRRPAGTQRAGGDGDGDEARGGDEQRRPRAERRKARGQQRPGREAGVPRRLDHARRLRQPPRARHRRHERELGRLGERVADGQQRRQREDHAEVAAERERDRNQRLGERGGDQHPHALGAVGDEPGQRRERDRRHEHRHQQRRHRDAAAGDVVDLQDQDDQREQVAGRREEDRGGQQSQVAAHG